LKSIALRKISYRYYLKVVKGKRVRE